MPPKRDYRREYLQYYGQGERADVTPTQRRHRLEKLNRDRARALMTKKHGPVRADYDIHHKDGNPLNNKLSNLQAVPRSINRSIKQKG